MTTMEVVGIITGGMAASGFISASVARVFGGRACEQRHRGILESVSATQAIQTEARIQAAILNEKISGIQANMTTMQASMGTLSSQLTAVLRLMPKRDENGHRHAPSTLMGEGG